jgi:RNA polymerase sigma-70 factor (ECF subfamily)
VILSMATAGELTSREIGEALGEPAGTVRYRLSQARKQLAAALDLEEGP